MTRLQEKIASLKGVGQPYFPENSIVDIEIENYEQITPEHVELALTSSYDDFCFDQRVTSVADRQTFESILELSSGNNDLGYFRSMYLACSNAVKRSHFHLSNYSGGRGDYFTLVQLGKLEQAILEKVSGVNTSFDIDSICVTYGGQGSYSALGHFLGLPQFEGKEVVFFDSAYCQNSKPFTRRGLKVTFMSTPETSHLPPCDAVVEKIEAGNVSALYYVKYHNPSGENYSDAEMRRIIRALKATGAYLIYAEAYETQGFGAAEQKGVLAVPAIAAQEQYERLVRVKTLSKERGFAGLRASYTIAPKEIVRFMLKFNDELGYNPAMANSKLMLLNTYFQYRDILGETLPQIEQWLDLGVDMEALYQQYRSDHEDQQAALFANVQMVAELLFGRTITEDDCDQLLENERFAMRVPRGGINCSIELKCLAGYDEIDMFRKIYLETGLIFHTSAFMFQKQGCWLRITLSHSTERIQRSLKTLLEIIDNHEHYEFLPKGTLSFRFHGPTDLTRTQIRRVA